MPMFLLFLRLIVFEELDLHHPEPCLNQIQHNINGRRI
jgi:hypothetical protein